MFRLKFKPSSASVSISSMLFTDLGDFSVTYAVGDHPQIVQTIEG